MVSIGGLRPEYVNNAIAGVRLSSLPTVVWWRGGRPEGLDGVATLADRVVLDAEDPWPLWARTPPLFEHTAFTDMRWARLTRWRAAMAHFFDLPEVRDGRVGVLAADHRRGDRARRRCSPAGSTVARVERTHRAGTVRRRQRRAAGIGVARGGVVPLELRLLPNSTACRRRRVGSDMSPRAWSRSAIRPCHAARRGAARPLARLAFERAVSAAIATS